MNGLEPETSDAAGRLWWGVRRYLPLLVLITIAGPAGALLAAPHLDEEEFEAPALIVATQVGEQADMRSLAEQLPRYATALFENGAVAARAIEEGGLEISPQALVEDHVDIEPVEGTLAVRLVGKAESGALAAKIANASAAALADAMDSAAPDLARYAVQETARRPLQAADRRSVPKVVAAGLLAGLLLGLGIVILLLTARRPVVSAREAAQLTGLAAIGTVRLPKDGTSEAALHAGGLATLVRSLFPQGGGMAAMVVTPGCEDRAGRLAELVLSALTRFGRVVLVPDGPAAERRARALADSSLIEVVDDPWKTVRDPAVPILVDGVTTAIDVVQRLPIESRKALVVCEGVGHEALVDAAAQFRRDDVVGIVFLRGG